MGHPKEDMDARGHRVILEKLESSRSLEARVLRGSAPDNADGSDAIRMSSSASSSVLLGPHIHLVTVARVKVREVLSWMQDVSVFTFCLGCRR